MALETSKTPSSHDVAAIQKNVNVEGKAPHASPSTTSIQHNLSELRNLLGFVIGLLLPYIFHPLLAIEVLHPGIATMWPFGTSFNPATGIKSLVGKTILVTGGNNGIGRETILQLAKHNPKKIYLASRTESKGREAIKSIKAETSNDVDIEHLPLDLTSLPSIKQAADQVTRQSDRLDILILNAGIMAVPDGKTASGQEIQMGTNHVGHFLLTKLLLPTLQKTANEHNSDVRIISVSSEAMNLAPDFETIISTEKLSATGTWTRYAASKASNIMFAAELARRYPSITSVSLHPGIIKTDLYTPNTSSSAITRYGLMLVGPLMFGNIQTGALNQLWAAVGATKEELSNGGYYTPVAKLGNNKWSTNADYGTKLWDWTESELKAAGY